MEISITWNICRVCLQEEPKSSNGIAMRQIFSGDNKLAKQIYECSGITMKPNDSLPDKICPKCISVLKYAVYFRKTCRNSDTYLQSVLQRTKLASNLFKPERSIDFDDDDILTDDPTDFVEEDKEHEKDPHQQQLEKELENKELLKRKRSESGNVPKAAKKVKSADVATTSLNVKETKEKNIQMEHPTNIDDKVAEILENHVDNVQDDVSKSKEKMEEEIIKNPKEIMEQMFSDIRDENSQIADNTEEVDEEVETTVADLELSDKRKPTILQEFYENENYTKSSKENLLANVIDDSEDDVNEGYNIIETSETHMQNTNSDSNDGLYYIYKEIKNETGSVESDLANDEEDNHINDDDDDADHIDAIEQDINEDDNENSETMDNAEFMPLYEEEHEVMLQLEQNMEDNQSLVTSTVITHEEEECDDAEGDVDEGDVDEGNDDEGDDNEIGDDDNDVGDDDYQDDHNYKEENSNSSNENQDLTTEYYIDEYLIDDSNSNNSSNKLQKTSRKLFATTSNKKRNSVILAGRRSKNKSDPINLGSKNVFVCNICNNHFTRRNLLNAHLKVHRQEKNHECEICFKRFITACNLQAHMRIHTGEKPFECQYCGRRFNDRSSNLRHERTHTNEKPFHCVHCGKSFALATTLHAHEKVHTGVRSYRCDACAKSFKLPHQLKAHQKSTLHKAVEQLVKLEN